MSRDLNKLTPKFREQVQSLLGSVKKEGVIMVPFFTTRTPQEQAKLWRQSRTTAQINEMTDRLRKVGAHFLANVIQDVGPQWGRWATNAIPGLSWHQWGEAVDCYWDVDGRAEWFVAPDDPYNGYNIYAATAQKMGLTSGAYWRTPDAVHVQLQDASSPAHAGHTLKDIGDMMHSIWGGDNEPRL